LTGINKDLIVGDLHIQVGNLEESVRLLDYISSTFVENQCRNLILLGDVFHTHAVIRQEVAYTILSFLKSFYFNVVGANKSRIIIVAGNHDGISPTNAHQNALELILSEFATVVSNKDGFVSQEGYVFLPFIHDSKEFENSAILAYITAKTMGISDPILICHQTFDGAVYESGAPCPSGVKSEILPYRTIISGHIHKRQIVNEKVVYVGTPRAITAGEANEIKYIHTVYRDESSGGVLRFTQISTKDIVKNYYKFDVDELDSSSHSIDLSNIDLKKDVVTVRVTGTQTFYDKFLEDNKQYLGTVRFVPLIKKDLSKVIRLESNNETVDQSLERYVKNIADLPDSMRGEVWETIQKMMV
jgi:DNA repair exonuclease SbcCD nuclease subunit